MKKIDCLELERITGGASPWVAAIIALSIVFVAGVIEGIVHPKSCNT